MLSFVIRCDNSPALLCRSCRYSSLFVIVFLSVLWPLWCPLRIAHNAFVLRVYIRKRMTEKRVKSVRLPADVAATVERMADERDLSESDMLRRLVEQGVAADHQRVTAERLEDIAESVDRIEQEVSRPWWRFW